MADAHDRGVEAIWNVGDFVGYGAFPDQVVRRLQEEEALSIMGNYDLKALKVSKKKDKWKGGKLPEKWFAFNWAYDNLSESSREYLSSLPRETRLEIAGKRILLTHGSPASNKEYVDSDTPEDLLRDWAEKADADIIICGHSHRPFKRKFEGVWFINTGSIGRPDDGDPRACYAIMHIRHRFFQLRHYRIEYDVEQAVAAIHDSGLPDAFAQMLLQGRSLDAVLEDAGQEDEITQSSVAGVEMSDELLKSILDLATTCGYEVEHTHQVARLALRLFDELQPLHNLGAQERVWLNIGALLHDIGWIEGQKGHHKTALHTILNTPLLPFDNGERLVIGSIARYHRKALPKKKHGHYASLGSSQRHVVSVLAGILRVADGLDRTHQSLIQDLSCEVTPEQIIVLYSVDRATEVEHRTALKKGRLLEKVLDRKLVIGSQPCQPESSTSGSSLAADNA